MRYIEKITHFKLCLATTIHNLKYKLQMFVQLRIYNIVFTE